MDELRSRINKLTQNATEFWKKLNRNQRIALGAGLGIIPLAILALIIFLAVKAGSPDYATLFTQLESEDAAAIVDQLKKENTPYELANNGTAIMIPRDAVFETRIQLAAQGIPAGGTVGYELFDKTKLGVTDFTQQVNLRRAIEGEISRTIMGLDAVEKARVMIVQPDESLFVVNEQKASASVALKIRKGKNLTQEQVRGIVNLVAASVKGLDSKSVVVVNSSGEILSNFDERAKLEEKFRLTELQLQHKKSIEKMYQDKINVALAKVFGEKNIVVTVSAELDYDVHTTEDEVYEPVVGDSGIPRSQQTIEEKYLGTGTVPEIGVPGTTSNIPGYKGLAEGNAQYNRNEQTTNFEVTRRLDKKEKNQGDIRRLSVAVMLNVPEDSDVKKYMTTKRVRDVQANVVAAANLDTNTRGDQVSVIPIQFTEEPNPLQAQYEKQQMWEERMKWFSIGLVVLAFIAVIVITLLALRRMVVVEEEPVEPEPESFPLEEAIPVEELLIPEISDEQRQRERVREEVLRIIHDDPEGAALIIRSWLFDNKEEPVKQ